MTNYIDCSGCGLMFNLDKPMEVIEYQEHNCEDDHSLDED